MKGRVLVRVLAYDAHSIMVTRKAVSKALMSLDKCLSVRLWYVRVLSVMPLPSPSATMASRPVHMPKCPFVAARVLSEAYEQGNRG